MVFVLLNSFFSTASLAVP